MVRSRSEAKSAWAALNGEQAILERYVDFAAELSVVAARGQDGEVQCYCPIANTHRNHILDVSTAPADFAPSVVVERATTATVDDTTATTVIVGAPPRQDGHVASTWHLGSGPPEPTTEALVLYNADNAESQVSVSRSATISFGPAASASGWA